MSIYIVLSVRKASCKSVESYKFVPESLPDPSRKISRESYFTDPLLRQLNSDRNLTLGTVGVHCPVKGELIVNLRGKDYKSFQVCQVGSQASQNTRRDHDSTLF